MKITNVSTTTTVYLRDLRETNTSQGDNRRGEDRYIGPGQSVYLQNTSLVLRSATKGEIRQYVRIGVLKVEDEHDLAAGASVVLTHSFYYPPTVYALKKVGVTWVDATGTVDVVHNADFTTVTVTNTTAFPLTFLIRLL